jgi:hypothetical protein
MKLRQGRAVRWLTAFALLITLVTMVGSASAAAPELTGQRTSAGFYPCTDPQDATPPTLGDCINATPLDVVVTGTCNPAGNSTMTLTVNGGAFGPFNGSYSETITWTVGPQTNPAVPAFPPFNNAPPAESVGLLTGKVLSLSSNFTIVAGGTTITGTKSLVDNDGNWGVCRQPVDQDLEGPIFAGPAPHTGEMYILGAGVLSYEATVDDGTPTSESGLAESYIMNSYLTCCSSASPSSVGSATGHFNSGFGTTHPAAGTSGTAPTPVGPGTVEPLPEVELTGTVVTAGTTTAVLTTSVPPLPAGFQVGNPPAFYEISTTADFTFPITVCIGYGALPPGTNPVLLHYEGGQWIDVTTSFTVTPAKVCGSVGSLSPFAAVFESALIYDVSGPFSPVDPQPTVNTMNAGRTVPVKFKLGGDFGLDVFEAGYPASQLVACAGGTPQDDVESTSSTGSGLSYHAGSGTYQYNWKTQKSWAGQCRTLILKFDDGQELKASFRFK